MKQIKKYKYIGRNGVLITPILIEGASKIDMYGLTADEGKVLTNGSLFLNSVNVYADELNDWVEVDDIGQD